MNELGAGNAFIDAQLNADPVLVSQLPAGVQADFLDEPEDGEEQYPACIFACISAGADSLGNGAVRVMAHPLYQVVVIGKGTYSEITDLADRVDAALHGQSATVTVNGTAYDVSCTRERVVPLPAKAENGVRFVRRGAAFRLEIQAV